MPFFHAIPAGKARAGHQADPTNERRTYHNATAAKRREEADLGAEGAFSKALEMCAAGQVRELAAPIPATWNTTGAEDSLLSVVYFYRGRTCWRR